MGGTRGSGVLSSACDVLEISVVRGVGGVCDMCVFGSGRDSRCWGERIGFGLYQSRRNRGKVGYVSVFWLRWFWVGGLGQGLRGWGDVKSM